MCFYFSTKKTNVISKKGHTRIPIDDNCVGASTCPRGVGSETEKGEWGMGGFKQKLNCKRNKLSSGKLLRVQYTHIFLIK